MAGELDPRAAGARRFDGQVAVITGGGQGIGSATARRLAQEGASIVIGDMVAETSDRVCAAIREFGGECVVSLGDLSRWENAEALMRRAMETYGRIDVLANIAGGRAYRRRHHLVPVLPVLHAGTDPNRDGPQLLDRHVVLSSHPAPHDSAGLRLNRQHRHPRRYR